MSNDRKETKRRDFVGCRGPAITERRRRFLKMMGGAAALGAAPLSIDVFGQTVATVGRAKELAKFVDPLPVMDTISPVGVLDRAPLYDVSMNEFRQKLHRDLPATTLWGYNGMYPGPTFETRSGKPIAVRWRNNLPERRHPLPVDPTLHGDEPPTPEVRTVVHLHGLKVTDDSDGFPEAWFTNPRVFDQRNKNNKGAFFDTFFQVNKGIYQYPNDQQACGLWYHDHSLGTTRLNIIRGLGGGHYYIRDDAEDALNLPSGRFEIPLTIQDRAFNADGSLFYPVQAPGDPEIPPVWVPEFFGDTVLVNGKVWPFLEVEPRKYRFRLLNASNARFYHLTLNEADADGMSTGNPGPAFIQIGTDGGFLPAPVTLTDLLVGPAERFDLIIDFSGAKKGQSFVLNNDAKAPFPDGDDVIPADVMLFKVKDLSGKDDSKVPAKLPAAPALKEAASVKTRDLVLIENASAQDNPIIGLINVRWDEPVTEKPKAGSTEIWRVINTTGDAHPIHVHLVQFNILDRTPFDPDMFPAKLVFTGDTEAPPANELGAAKDVVKAPPGVVSRIIARFDLPTGTKLRRGETARYVMHCNILEHEDNDMMRPCDVVG